MEMIAAELKRLLDVETRHAADAQQQKDALQQVGDVQKYDMPLTHSSRKTHCNRWVTCRNKTGR